MNWLDFGVKRSNFKVTAWPNASQIFIFPLYLQYLSMDFRQTFVTGASRDTDDLITFLGQKVKVQGYTIVAEAHSTRRYHRVQLFLVLSLFSWVCIEVNLENLLVFGSYTIIQTWRMYCVSVQNLTGLMCGHEFCRSCWCQYLTVKIMDEGMGQVSTLSCPTCLIRFCILYITWLFVIHSIFRPFVHVFLIF